MTAASDTPTPLASRLIRRIAATGPISIAEYMATCLGDPEHGYYMRRDPFGAAGDFVTAPEISQIFGELIGLWAVATWEAMGAPPHFVLAELGPGRGTLMKDVLRAARIRPAFAAAARLQLVETSLHLRTVQAATLAQSGSLPIWLDGVEQLPDGPAIILANEFFDALPIRQLVRTSTGWAERMVGIDTDERLAFGLREISAPSAAPRASRAPAAGDVLELHAAADATMSIIAARLARSGGAALAIDYGHAEPGFGDTLQALYRHAYDDPLAHPGEADLTAHVDFSALARAAVGTGAMVMPILTQSEFLSRLGIGARAARLSAGQSADVAAQIKSAVTRLTSPVEMGTLFKVMAVAGPGLAVPAF